MVDYHEGALEAIDGTLVQPVPLTGSPTPEQQKEYNVKCDLHRKANSYAKSTTTSLMSDSVYQKVMEKETAHDVWVALRAQFEASAKDQLFKLCIDFFIITFTNLMCNLFI